MDAKITVIGAGVIGLAITEYLSRGYDNVFLIEKNPTFGQETSSRNSEVIHAGIYYPEGSLKALLCVEGSRMLYDYCDKFNIPHKKCGKLIVAVNEEEVVTIEGIRQTALRNGVMLETVDKGRIAELEPNIFALKALWSPITGIVDSHSLMKQLETNLILNGGQVVYGSEVTAINKISEGYRITLLESGASIYNFTSEIVINSAGLYSDKIAEMVGIKDEKLVIRFCKGEYFGIKPPKNRLLNRLIYPIPHKEMEGIGVHVTVDMGGGARLGPDVTFLDGRIFDYKVDASKQEAFFNSARKFLPFLEYDDIEPGMAGIRPKIQRKGDPQMDWYIKEESSRGLPGFINLIGMESPGLTSCLSISKYVANLIANQRKIY